MAAIAQATVESLVASIDGAVTFNITAAQAAQAQGPLYQLLKILFGPAATSTVILNGASTGTTGAPNGAAQ